MYKDFMITGPDKNKDKTNRWFNNTKEDVLKFVNTYNGIANCYMSVNPYELDGEKINVHITRAYFDFDNYDIESVRRFVEYLLNKNIKFEVYLSGNGHNVYVYCHGNPQNLRVMQHVLLDEAKVKCDEHVLGDIRRVSRIPNTWHMGAQKFCIPLKVEEIGHEDASKQRFEKFIYGNVELDLNNYKEEDFEYLKPKIVGNLNISTDVVLLPCIRNILAKANPRHDERFLLVVYLSDAYRNGISLEYFDKKEICNKIIEFLNKYATHWLDYNPTKTSYWVNNIGQKFDMNVTCVFIRQKGACIGCSN